MSTQTKRSVVIGTRGSALALWQAEYVAARLRGRFPGRAFEIQTISTSGDVARSVALAEIGTRGIFVKEIQAALLAGEVDLGVHSLKDLPSEPAQGLTLAAASDRADPRDALVSRHAGGLMALPSGARLGTSSPRRAAQLRALRSDLRVENMRGNVDTRVRKGLGEGWDGVVLAAAGLHRLGLDGHICEYLSPAVMVPAPCQGIIGVEARADDDETLALAAAIDDHPARLAAEAERSFVRALGGGCYTPLGAYASVKGGVISLVGLLASPAGDIVLRAEATGDEADPAGLGTALAARLLATGGREILDRLEK